MFSVLRFWPHGYDRPISCRINIKMPNKVVKVFWLFAIFILVVIFIQIAGNVSPKTGYRITLLFGVINIITLLLVFFSCRCLVGSKFIKGMWDHKWYQKYYRSHCYYWWIFMTSVILHTVFAIITFGNPF